MNSLKKLASFWTVCLIACGLATSVYAHDAKVVKLTGDVQVQLPGESEAKPLTADMAIPQGSTIITGPGAEVYVEALPGVVATIKANTTVSVEKLALDQQGGVVTSQEALLDLKKGNIISTLDPTKKAINHYGVKTPKGVAAARGTVYGTSVTFDTNGQSTTTVATMTGVVTLNLGVDGNGNPVFVDVPFGQAATAGGSDQAAATTATLEAAIAASGQTGLTVEQLMQEAVEAVAANVAANTSAAGGSDTSTAVLAAVVSAASSAQPAKAAQFVNTAVAAAVSAGSATGGTTTTSNAAVAAIVSAGVRAAPNAAATISQGAAATVVQTKTTQAAAAASNNGGDATAAAAAAAAEAAETLSTIAQTAVNAAAASGSSVNAAQITNAVNTGSQQGATAASAVANVTVTVTPPSVSQPTANTQTSPTINTPQTTVDLPPVSPTSPVR